MEIDTVIMLLFGFGFLCAFIFLSMWVRKYYNEIYETQRFILFCGSFVFIIIFIYGILEINRRRAGIYENLSFFMILFGILFFGLSNIYTHFTNSTQPKS